MSELLAMTFALVIHEIGHLFTAWLLGIKQIRFRVSPMGGVLTFDFSHASYGREAAVHFGGPAAGLLSAGVMWILLHDFFFTGISVTLALVNLLPIRGLDGGGILACVLNRFCSSETAWKIWEGCSVCGILLLWTAVLWIELRVRANIGLLAFVLTLLWKLTKRPEDT